MVCHYNHEIQITKTLTALLHDRNNKAIGVTLLMVIQHGGCALVRKQYESSRCSG